MIFLVCFIKFCQEMKLYSIVQHQTISNTYWIFSSSELKKSFGSLWIAQCTVCMATMLSSIRFWSGKKPTAGLDLKDSRTLSFRSSPRSSPTDGWQESVSVGPFWIFLKENLLSHQPKLNISLLISLPLCYPLNQISQVYIMDNYNKYRCKFAKEWAL